MGRMDMNSLHSWPAPKWLSPHYTSFSSMTAFEDFCSIVIADEDMLATPIPIHENWHSSAPALSENGIGPGQAQVVMEISCRGDIDKTSDFSA